MPLAARIAEKFRNRLSRAFGKERQSTGCAETAMKRISSKLGMSKASLYRAMNGYGEVQIKAHHYVALLMVTFASRRAAKRRVADFAFPQNEMGQPPVFITLEN